MTESGEREPQRAALDEWLTPAHFALVLGALIFAAFPQVLLGLETFIVRDFGFFAYPLAHYQRECFWRGELPLWNPYNNCGGPFLAQWNTMALYPPALLYLLLPLTWSLSFFCLLHLFSAGLGMYFLAGRWTGNRLAAAAAGVVFAFNGLSLHLLMWPSHIATLSWMPWVVLSVERAWREGGRQVIWAALVGALQMLAGGPEIILFTWLILTALWLGHIWAGWRTRRRAHDPGTVVPSLGFRVWVFPLVVFLVACLAAAQLLPFLDLAAHSQREPGYADARWSMPAWGWANFLVPMVFGSTSNHDLFYQYGQYWTSSYYLGIGALLFALLGVRTPGDCRARLLALAAGAALVLAWGDTNFVSHWVRRLIPQLSLITYPIKYVTVAVFAAPLLAAFAIAALRGSARDARAQKRLVWGAAVLLALVGGILLWAWRWPFPLDDFPATLRNGLTRAALLVAATGVWLLLGRNPRPALQRILTVLFLAVLWLDVWTHQPNQNPTVPPGVYEPGMIRQALALNPQPALGESRAMVSAAAEAKFMQLALKDMKQNFLAKRLGYFANCNLLDGVPKVNGFFSLYPRECGELNSVLYLSTNQCTPRLADFMSVAQLTATNDFTRWDARDTFLPLATAGQRPVFLDDTNALFGLVGPEFDAKKIVLLPLEAQPLVSVSRQTAAQVRSQRFSPQRVELEVEAAEPSLVVISQTYYHCWRAYVDGRPVRLLRANYAFQAVEVPPGSHNVLLAYKDRAFHAGAAISGATLLVCLAALAGLNRTSQNSKPV